MSLADSKISEVSTKTLSEWQKLAYDHFIDLSTTKKEKSLPVFALEHCFSTAQLEIIVNLLLKDYQRKIIDETCEILGITL